LGSFANNVVQLVTDNGAIMFCPIKFSTSFNYFIPNILCIITFFNCLQKYFGIAKLLQGSRPKIFWTPCDTYCINFIIEEIGKIPKVKKVVAQGIRLVGFIYKHYLILNLLRDNAEMELIRYGVTRFATNFLTLQMLYNLKEKN